MATAISASGASVTVFVTLALRNDELPAPEGRQWSADDFAWRDAVLASLGLRPFARPDGRSSANADRGTGITGHTERDRKERTGERDDQRDERGAGDAEM